MSLIGRIIRNTENLLSKNWAIAHVNGWNELAYFSNRVEIPLPPKRPLTAYMIFCKENRKNVLQENPALSRPEQIKRLAEKWGQLTVDSKKPFEIMAREGTVLYGEEHKKFFENLSEDQKVELAKRKAEKRVSRRLLRLKKAIRESGIPKPAVSAYALFVQSQAKDKSNLKQPSDLIKNIADKWIFSREDSQKVFIKVVAEKWNALSEETKKSFEERAQAEKIRYSSEIEEWRERMVREGKTDLLKEYDMWKSKGKSHVTEAIDTFEGKVKKRSAAKELESKPKAVDTEK